MHGLCRFFLENCGPGLEIGDYDFIPFIIHMPNLFESFGAEWMRTHLPSDYKIKIQYRARLDLEGNFGFKIDLVLIDTLSEKTIGVLDTKYKRKFIPEEDDIQQIVAYAVSMRTDNAFLIYPSSKTKKIDIKVGQHVRVRSMVFDIGEDPDLAGNLFLESLFKNIKS